MVTLNVSDTQVAQVDHFIKGPVTYQLVSLTMHCKFSMFKFV